MKRNDPVSALKGAGEKTAQALGKAGVYTIEDLLRFFPVRYERFDPPVTIAEAPSGKVCTLRGTFSSQPQSRRTGSMIVTTISLRDDTGLCRLTWFRMPYLARALKKGDHCLVRGRFSRGPYGIVMEQPRLYGEEEYAALQATLQPVYPQAGKLSAKQVGKLLHQTFERLEEDESGRDPLPAWIREKYGLEDWSRALRTIHFPPDEQALLHARERLVFEEFLRFILEIRMLREQKGKSPNRCACTRFGWAQQLEQRLPYELTGAQKRVWAEIRGDLAGSFLMNRLVQGDVGSGKTVLAQLAMTAAAENGYQSALMAPTEVLAEQHYEGFRRLAERCGLPLRCLLLTGSLTAAQKKEAYRRIRDHEADIIIGTHALIQEKVAYDRLGLVVTDEQHRFGVRQREMLAGKGEEPHILVMSATPIPRTLAIILYGDLDLSAVDELPASRRPIKNTVVGPEYRPRAYEFLRKQVQAGRQAYVICPLVEESDGLEAENVKDYTEKLRGVLPPGIRVEMLHGKMRPKEKNERMDAFRSGEIQILVSTTVVEVGVDVPNATVMMIENAERFGLAQLHQLRGRVGRGEHQSYCIFLDSSEEEEKNRRLQVLVRSNDGFEIASQDLKLRGPGDVFGIRQSGELEFALGDIYTDARILQEASEACAKILEEDPLLEREENRPLRRLAGDNRERLSL